MRTAATAWLFMLAMACGHTAQRTPIDAADTSDPKRDSQEGSGRMIVRISEIDIDPVHLEKYKQILKEEAEASVRLEPWVISIFPMYRRDDSTAVRILAIYASREAYEAHIGSPHFQRYKRRRWRWSKT